MQIDRKSLVEALLTAYNLGVYCTKEVNCGSRRWTTAKGKKERAALDSLLKQFGCEKLSDEEYIEFCD